VTLASNAPALPLSLAYPQHTQCITHDLSQGMESYLLKSQDIAGEREYIDTSSADFSGADG